jgi:hypothetical protein
MAPTDVRVRNDEPATEPKLGLLRDIVDELRWTYNGRRGWLLSMAGNLILALVVVGYSDYDPHVAGDFKIAYVGIAVVLYVLADTVTTNQLGADSDRVLASVEGHDSVRRILAIKNLALAALLVPVAVLVSVIFRILVDRWRLFTHTAMYDVGAVFVWLGLGDLVSVLLPYRPIRLRARLKARKTWKRWGVRQAVPYALYYLGGPVLVLLPFAILSYLKVFGPARMVGYPVLFLANAVAGWLLGLWLADLYAERHRTRFLKELRREE